MDYWVEHRPSNSKRRTKRRPKRKGQYGTKLTAALNKYDAETVLNAFRWTCEGQHRDAQWVRRNVTGLFETTLRYAEKYADAWEEHGQTTRNMSYEPDNRPIEGVRDEALDWPEEAGEVPL